MAVAGEGSGMRTTAGHARVLHAIGPCSPHASGPRYKYIPAVSREEVAKKSAPCVTVRSAKSRAAWTADMRGKLVLIEEEGGGEEKWSGDNRALGISIAGGAEGTGTRMLGCGDAVDY